MGHKERSLAIGNLLLLTKGMNVLEIAVGAVSLDLEILNTEFWGRGWQSNLDIH